MCGHWLQLNPHSRFFPIGYNRYFECCCLSICCGVRMKKKKNWSKIEFNLASHRIQLTINKLENAPSFVVFCSVKFHCFLNTHKMGLQSIDAQHTSYCPPANSHLKIQSANDIVHCSKCLVCLFATGLFLSLSLSLSVLSLKSLTKQHTKKSKHTMIDVGCSCCICQYINCEADLLNCCCGFFAVYF